QAREVRSEKLAPEIACRRCLGARRCGGCGRPRTLGEKARGDRREVLAFQLGGSVHLAHARVVDPAFELLERGPDLRQSLRQIGAVEQHRVITREIAAIVVEYRQAILVDLGVGRIDIDLVDLVYGDRLLHEAVIKYGRTVAWKVG